MTKFPCPVFLMIAKDCTERLSVVALSIGLHYSARLMSFGSRGPSEFFAHIRHRNAFTEIAWEDAEQGLGMVMSTLALEKNRELLFIGNLYFTNSDISRYCFTSISRARPPENRKF